MPNRSRTGRSGPEDFTQIAYRVVQQATADKPVETETITPPTVAIEKDPAAVALGRRGGLVGGKARAARMTPEERSASARNAAAARWMKGAGNA